MKRLYTQIKIKLNKTNTKVETVYLFNSYLDTKSTVNSYKLVIPYICRKSIGRRTLDDEDEEQPPEEANIPMPPM